MAAVTVAFDGTRLSEAESETDGGTWDQWGSKNSPTQETDFVYQLGASSAAISHKVSSGTGGIDFDSTGTNDLTTPKVILALVNVTTYGLIDTTVHKGAAYQIGSSGSDYYDFYIFGSKKGYPPKGGWVILAIDPNELGYRAATVGTPALASADYYGWWADITGSAKAENVVHDTLSILAYGDGLTLTRGDSTDPDGVFQDFVDYDEGTVANRWGIVTTAEGALIVVGWLNIGDSAGTNPTVFNDEGAVVFWPETLTAEAFNGLKIYLGNASDDFQVNGCVFQGNGRGFPKDFFHTQTDVDDVNEVITLDTDVDWQDLDYILYSNEGGSDAIGLTSGNYYWIAWDSTNSGWAIYSTRDNAATDTSRIGLTDGSTGENHSFLKDPDTRPDLIVSGTTGIQAAFSACSVINFRNVTLTSKASLSNCRIECKLLTQSSADIEDSTIVTTSETSIATLQDPTFGQTTDLHDCEFIQGGSGHAIEIDTATTYNFYGLTFTGYGADTTDSAALDVTAASGTVTINVFGGSTPTYKTAGATVNIVVDPVTVLVHVEDENGNDLQSVRVAMWAADGTGIYPFDETVSITRSGSVATVSHTAHGMITGDYVKIDKTVDQVEYSGIHQITYINANSYSYTVSGAPATPATGTIKATGGFLSGTTDVNGDISRSRVVSADTPIQGNVRLSTTTPKYKTFELAGNTVDDTNGLTVNIRMVRDD